MIKLIVSDMDGTLLNNKDQINTEFWEIQKKLSKNGIIFAVASGRPYYNLIERFKNIKDSILFISENGAYVMYQEKEIYSNTMKREDIFFLLNICKNIKGIVPILCGKKSAYVEKNIYSNDEYNFKEEIAKYYNKLEIVEDLNNVEDEFFKIAVCDFLISEKNSYKYFKDYEDKFQVVISGKVWMDLGKLDTSKGLAVKMAQKNLNVSYDETMVFGDYLNDCSMMSEGKYSYAMLNAHPKLKEIASFITRKDNNNNGVLETIKEYF
ncbi:Sugar phosphatase SupH [Fusobacterium necrogenes]|uniref:Sugar phosphatase SupH n=1 Tax=Fusobacterium necrogenes TaxID=858 RepID=A0A377GWJ0_9FUSO|nr:HAD family hydrolase [Fusobacterium necrogenes]STO30974.1 Sugar phosphatase SupH [Fusobacterium necrogenes]